MDVEIALASLAALSRIDAVTIDVSQVDRVSIYIYAVGRQQQDEEASPEQPDTIPLCKRAPKGFFREAILC